MQTIQKDDVRINYRGRFAEDKRSGWQGAQSRFKLSGLTSFKVTSKIKDITTDNQAFFVVNIDKADAVLVELTTLPESYIGDKDHTFTLPDTGEHTIILKVFMWPTPQWDISTAYNALKTIEIADEGTLSAWDSGPTIALCVGDSWMGTSNDWPMLLSDRYDLWSVSFGGATAATLDSRVDYMYSGQLLTDEDPIADIIFFNSAVNDYKTSVPTGTYEASLASEIDKLRTQQPTATIFILSSPDNTGAGKIFSQYNQNMINVASVRDNVFFVDMGSIDSWLNDYHLDYAGRQIWSDRADAAVIAQLGYQVEAGTTKPWIAENRLAIGRFATVYDGLTPYSFNKPGVEPVDIATPGTSALYIG